MRRFFISLAVLCALVSCERLGGDNAAAELVEFSLDTRATPAVSGQTYRIMAYKAVTDGSRFSLLGTGTYYLKDVNDKALTACNVDDYGVWQPGDGESLNGHNSNVFLTAVSPAVRNNPDGSFTVNPAVEFLSTHWEERNIGGYGIVSLKSNLRDTRSRVTFKFYKLNDLSVMPFTVKDIYLKGIGDTGESLYFYPATKQCLVVNNEELGRELTWTEHTDKVDVPGYGLCYYSTPEDYYVPAAYYVSRSKVAQLLGNTPFTGNIRESDVLSLSFTMNQNGRDVSIQIPLTSNDRLPELQALHSYTFHIVAKSNYINVSVEIAKADGSTNSWQLPTEAAGETIDEVAVKEIPLGTFTIGAGGGGWFSPDEAGNETVDKDNIN